MPLKNRKINFSQKYPLRQRWVGETAKYIYERLNYFCKHDGPGPGHKLGSADSEAEKKLVFNQILQNYLSIAYKPWASRVFGLPPTWVLSGSNMPIQKAKIKFSHHKAFIGVDDVEESEEDIDGDDFQGVKDDHTDLHVMRAGEAGSCLHKIDKIKGWGGIGIGSISMEFLLELMKPQT